MFTAPTYLLSAILFPFGLALGSFANVLIHRLPLDSKTDRDVIITPSRCNTCGVRIRPQHNIPILSWIYLKGRCAYCGCKISVSYPIVELLVGLLLSGSVWIFPFGTLIWIKGVICGYSLITLFFTDFNTFILPNVIQFTLMAIGVLLTLPQLINSSHVTFVYGLHNETILQVNTFVNCLQPAPILHITSHPITITTSIIGLIVGYSVPMGINFVYRCIRKTDGIGMGDFKMLAWLGSFWGWASMLGIMFIGALLGSILGLSMIFFAKGNLRHAILPFGCTLALATPMVVFYGSNIWHSYLEWVLQ